MSALSKFSTMKRPLGAVAGAAGTRGGIAGGGGVAGAVAGRPGSAARGPTETGGSGVVGSVWTVTVGGGRGPMGGVAIFGIGVRVAHPATSESRTALARKPLTLLLRRIAHAGWQTAQQVRWDRSPAGNDRWDGRLAGHADHRRLRLPRNDAGRLPGDEARRSEEHTSELQAHGNVVCRLRLDKKKREPGGAAARLSGVVSRGGRSEGVG